MLYPRLLYVSESLRWLVQYSGPLKNEINKSHEEEAFWSVSVATRIGGQIVCPLKIDPATYVFSLVTDDSEAEQRNQLEQMEREVGVMMLNEDMNKTPKKKKGKASTSDSPLSADQVKDIPDNL